MSKTASQKQIFEELPVLSAIRVMCVPTIISQLIILIYNMADTFYLGQTHNPFMVAATALILPIFNIAASVAGLAGIGGGTCVSRLLGKGDRQEAARVSTFSIRLGIAFAGAFALLTALFMQPLLSLLGAGENTRAFAAQYATCVVVIGGIPTVLSNVLANLIRSEGYSRKAGFGLTMGGVLNIALDPIFMFVLMPKGSEMLGAGIATCVSNIIACLYFAATIRGFGGETVVRWTYADSLPRKESILSVFSVGVPSAIATFLFDMDYVVLDKLMSGYGDFALAAIGIVLKVERLPLNIGIGICQGMVPLIAYNYSSGNLPRMHSVIRYSRAIGLIMAGFSICLYELGAGQLIRLFMSDPTTLALGTNFLRVRIIATPLMFMSFFTVHLFNAFGKGQTALFLGVARWLVFNIPMLFLLNYLVGMYGLVWSQVTADILTVALSVYVFRRWVKNGNQ